MTAAKWRSQFCTLQWSRKSACTKYGTRPSKQSQHYWSICQGLRRCQPETDIGT